jgi:polysaccharide export outer membrane protein
MRKIVISLCAVFTLTACTEILRKPTFQLNDIENAQEDVAYEVTGFEATPQIVSRANSAPFVLYVNVGGNGDAAVQRVPEKALFSGRKPRANQRPKYRIGVGDTIEVLQTGHGKSTQGIATREVLRNAYLVNEKGAISLIEGQSVMVAGLTIADATQAVNAALGAAPAPTRTARVPRDFPTTPPPTYLLGVGDIIRVSQLVETTNEEGRLVQTIRNSSNTVASNGLVSILLAGDIEAAGMSLSQVRDQVVQAATRNAGSLDTVVEIATYASQSALVPGALGTRVIPITDQPTTYATLIAQLNPPFAGGRDYRVDLERNGEVYQMNASTLVSTPSHTKHYVFNGDRVTISEITQTSKAQLTVTNFGARTLTYLRINDAGEAPVHQGREVPFDLRGTDLRQFLVKQGIDVTQNEDLLVRLNRGSRTYNLSAQSVVLNSPNLRYWLAPDDNIVVENIAYVGNSAILVGELGNPRQLPVDKYRRTTLTNALFDGEAFSDEDADFKHIYVLRGEGLKYAAYHFDISQVLNLSLAERFELRPGDIVFVRTRPLTRYARALSLALGVSEGTRRAVRSAADLVK